MTVLGKKSGEMSISDKEQATQLFPNIVAKHIPTTANRPKRNIVRKSYVDKKDDSESNDSFDDFSADDEDEYQPPKIIPSQQDTDTDDDGKSLLRFLWL